MRRSRMRSAISDALRVVRRGCAVFRGLLAFRPRPCEDRFRADLLPLALVRLLPEAALAVPLDGTSSSRLAPIAVAAVLAEHLVHRPAVVVLALRAGHHHAVDPDGAQALEVRHP